MTLPSVGGMKPACGCLPKGKQQVWVTFPEVQISLILPGKVTNQSQAKDWIYLAEFMFFFSNLSRFLQE